MQSDTTHYGSTIEIYAVQGPSRAGLLATWLLIGACAAKYFWDFTDWSEWGSHLPEVPRLPRTIASIWVAFFSRACMLLKRVLRVWGWYAGRSDVCVRPLDSSFTSQLILTGGCLRLLPSPACSSSPSSSRSCSRSSSVRPQEAWLILQQFCVSTGGSTEFSTGPVLGRLRHRHPDSRVGLEGRDGSTLCCRGPIKHHYHKQKEVKAS